MNNEIKEILDNIKNKYEDYYVQDIVSGEDLKILLDYITNLQKENERLKEWKEDLLKENVELENIRKEAIEYVKEHQRKDEFLNLNEWQTRDLLNILKGGDDNE